MTRKLSTEAKETGRPSKSSYKVRDDTGFNPFMEVQKIIEFGNQAGRVSCDVFSVYVKDGILEWTKNRLNKKHPGFIAVIDRRVFGEGLTTSGWRKLEERIAIELCKQRKAW